MSQKTINALTPLPFNTAVAESNKLQLIELPYSRYILGTTKNNFSVKMFYTTGTWQIGDTKGD